MKAQFVEDMKAQLEHRLSQLLPEGRTAASPNENEDAGVDRFSDPLDIADFHSRQELRFQMLNRKNASVEKIKRALKRIRSGSFGVCDDCGDDIDINRLRVRPHATRCIQCKSHAERLQKAAGF